MSGLPGDEKPNPQWQRPQEPSQWQSQWQQGSPLGDQEEQQPPSEWQHREPQWQSGGRTPGQAVASLILGIFAVFPFCPWVFAIPALICGYNAKRQIDGSAGALGGRGLALAGIILGWASLAFWTLLFLAVVAI